MAKNQRVVLIFLLILSAALIVFIGLQLISYYKTGRSFTEENMRPSITCTGYIYTIKGLSYSRNELSLTVYNLDYSDYEIGKMSVKANSTYTRDTRIPQGIARELKYTISGLPDEFIIYPENCITHAKTCNLQAGTCR